MEIYSIISGIIGLIVLIVFFVMANNINNIKTKVYKKEFLSQFDRSLLETARKHRNNHRYEESLQSYSDLIEEIKVVLDFYKSSGLYSKYKSFAIDIQIEKDFVKLLAKKVPNKNELNK